MYSLVLILCKREIVAAVPFGQKSWWRHTDSHETPRWRMVMPRWRLEPDISKLLHIFGDMTMGLRNVGWNERRADRFMVKLKDWGWGERHGGFHFLAIASQEARAVHLTFRWAEADDEQVDQNIRGLWWLFFALRTLHHMSMVEPFKQCHHFSIIGLTVCIWHYHRRWNFAW